MNEPIGRLGSCSPARARRTAVDTAVTASDWPTTRLTISSSMRSSLSRSPSSILSTGMPVQRDTTWAMRSAVTTSVRHGAAFVFRLFDLLELGFEVGDHAVGELSGFGEVALPLRLLELDAGRVELLLQLLRVGELALLLLPAAGEQARFLLEIGELLLELGEPVL